MKYLSESISTIAHQEFTLAIGAFAISILLIFVILRIRYWQKMQQEMILDLLNDYLVADTDNTLILEYEISKLLRNRYNRQPLIDEMINKMPHLSADEFAKVEHLYHLLNLEEDALFKVERGNWFLIAKGLREIGALRLTKHTNLVLAHLDFEQPVVVLEAQKALLSIHGFRGLYFFRNLSTPLSQWNQVCLLSVLAQQNTYSPSAIRSLIAQPNASLAIFALAILRRFELTDLLDIASACVRHSTPEVQRMATQTIAALRASALNNYSKLALVDSTFPPEVMKPTSEDTLSLDVLESTFLKVESINRSVNSLFNSIPALLLYPRAMLLAK